MTWNFSNGLNLGAVDKVIDELDAVPDDTDHDEWTRFYRQIGEHVGPDFTPEMRGWLTFEIWQMIHEEGPPPDGQRNAAGVPFQEWWRAAYELYAPGEQPVPLLGHDIAAQMWVENKTPPQYAEWRRENDAAASDR